MSTTEFAVTVQRTGCGWEVEVHSGAGTEARTAAPSLDVALAMAVPYMAAVAEPDPFAGLFDGLDNIGYGPLDERRAA